MENNEMCVKLHIIVYCISSICQISNI